MIRHLRCIAIFEGVSYLLLLFVAMPLKYGMDHPIAVTVAGSVHGILFIWLCVLLALAVVKSGLSIKLAATVFIASLIPFGTFFTDKPLSKSS
jgi:integral membrane protein